jgi:AcrR family transcriptional regulator
MTSGSVAGDGPEAAVRRAPFGDNPAVGERGQQAQQRILTAALKIFGDVGYHQCRVHLITELAGCSRVSFYQYFSSKEDLFRHLAGRVARRLSESIDQVESITPDTAGRAALFGYFERYSAIYDEYQPIFVAFQTAASSDEAMAEGGHRVAVRVLARLEAKVAGSSLAGPALQSTLRTIVESAVRANRLRELVEEGEPPVRLSRPRLNAALADISHRALFGVIPDVNLTTPARRPRVFPNERSGAGAGAAGLGGGAESTAGPTRGAAGTQTRASILEAGHRVYSERGYYATRVDDVVRVAGVSHGVFYRYFRNKDELFRLLALQASQRFTDACAELGQLDPAAPDARDVFRAWLSDYGRECGESAAIMRVWVDALTRDPQLGSDSANVIRAGCRAVLPLLERRGQGDAEPEAVVMQVLLEEMTSDVPSARRIAGIGAVIERSLLFFG